MKKITLEEYKNHFDILKQNNGKQEEALKQALDIRKFEIDLYWKRASYFWTFIAAIFAGYFLVFKNSIHQPSLLFLVSCLGFLFSLCWYLVNRGSKFWQNNWERHVDLLEDRMMGPLYKTVLTTGEVKWRHLSREYNYSVSRLNQLLSLYVTVIWLLILVDNLFRVYMSVWKLLFSEKFLHIVKTYSNEMETLLFIITTFIFACVLLLKGGNGHIKSENKKETNIYIRE